MDSVGVLLIGTGVFLLWTAYKNIGPTQFVKALVPTATPATKMQIPQTPGTQTQVM